MEDSLKKLNELVKNIDFAMLTTLDPDGHLRSRPMSTQKLESDGSIWFFTEKSSGKIHSIETNQQVNLSYSKPSDSRFVSVSGEAEIVDDKAKAKELWNPILKAWFPEGVDDPNLILLKINIQSAEYWDGPSSKLVQLAGFVKAVLTGKKADGGKNERIEIKH